MILRLYLALALLAGCDSLPKDPDGTLDRVRREKQFRVGLIATDAPVAPARQSHFLGRVAGATGARPVLERGPAEPLLARLEKGELDLVIGEFAPASPWKAKVAFLPPLSERLGPDGRVQVIAAARNGENGWISLLHGPAADLAKAP